MIVVFIIVLLAYGFVVGALARLAVPGPDPMPVWLTMLIGVAGSVIGGVVAKVFLGYAGGFIFAFAGAVLLVVLYRTLVQKRPLTGPGARRLPPPR